MKQPKRPKRPIHERVRARVELAGLSAADIASQSEWSEQRVQRLLRGSTRILAEDMEIFARILRENISDLYSDPRHGTAA